MLTVAELNAIRERVRKELMVRTPHGRLVVGVGTVGIAAGAREIMAVAIETVNTLGLDLVVTGEDLPLAADQLPAIKFIASSGEEILYTQVTLESTKEIVEKLADKVSTAADS